VTCPDPPAGATWLTLAGLQARAANTALRKRNGLLTMQQQIQLESVMLGM